MALALQKQIAQAVRAGMDLGTIDETIIHPAAVEDDEKAAMWLYAQVLQERPRIVLDGAPVNA